MAVLAPQARGRSCEQSKMDEQNLPKRWAGPKLSCSQREAPAEAGAPRDGASAAGAAEDATQEGAAEAAKGAEAAAADLHTVQVLPAASQARP